MRVVGEVEDGVEVVKKFSARTKRRGRRDGWCSSKRDWLHKWPQ